MAKKTKWSLVPSSADGLAAAPPAVPVPGTIHETKDVHRKWVANTAEEIAKAQETWQVAELADALNAATTHAGVETIEHYVALSNQPRDPDAQSMVDQYLPRRTNKQLQQRERITDTGVKEMEQILDRPLTPDPPAKPEKKGLFDW